eukprot:scaffold65224_cov50-Prasinocladus_malaysianus.AAC.1
MTKPQDSSVRASTTGGGVQHHSIFGWANEKAEAAVSETRLQSQRAITTSYAKHAAGAKMPGDPAPRKVSDVKIKANAGNNIFGAEPARAPKAPTRRQQEMSGSNIFGGAASAPARRPASAHKSKELSGNSGIFGDDGGASYQARPTTPSVRITQPAGGKSTFSFGDS